MWVPLGRESDPVILTTCCHQRSVASVVDDWLQQRMVRLVEPSERHWEILTTLLDELGTAGNLTSDAHLAALAIEHGARLCSTDNDFSRFEHLRWENPLA